MWLWAAMALAAPNMNLSFDAGVEVPLGPVDGPRGRELTFRVGAGTPFLIGDSCGFNEYPDCRGSSFWPLAGPRAALRASLEQSVTVELGACMGLMHAEMAQSGWVPLWQIEARAAAELGVGGVSLAVGAVGTRSLSWRKNVTPTGYTQGGGWEPLALQLGYLVRPVGVERPPTLLTGLGLHVVAMSYTAL